MGDDGLDDLRWHWDTAYSFGWDGRWFTARRVDDDSELAAKTVDELAELIRRDYAARPVPRD